MERICKVHRGALSGGCGHCLLDLLCSSMHKMDREGKERIRVKTTLKEWAELNKQLSGSFDFRKFYGSWTKKRDGVSLYSAAYAKWCVYQAGKMPTVQIPEAQR